MSRRSQRLIDEEVTYNDQEQLLDRSQRLNDLTRTFS
jgi:hypothetical protein